MVFVSGMPADSLWSDPTFRDREFDDPDWIRERAVALAAFLSNGLLSLKEVLSVRDLCNAVMAQGSASHPMWIPNKNVGALDLEEPIAAAAILTEVSQRIARKLSLLPFLDYDHATDEDGLSVLLLSMIQAGFRPLGSIEEVYEFFSSKCPLPMVGQSCVPPPNKERKTRVADVMLEPLPSGWVRTSPYAVELDALAASRIDGFASAFKGLSGEDQRRLLDSMGVPSGVDKGADPGPVPPGLNAGVGLPANFGSQMAEGLRP